MLNLAIECSGLAGSVALCHGREMIASLQLPSAVGSVQSLAPAIDELLSHIGPPAPRRVDLISVTHGPGSFTGLRVGLATAQTLAFAWKIPVAPVDTLAAIAHGLCIKCSPENTPSALPTNQAGSTMVVPVLNAFRKQVFVSAWMMLDPVAQPSKLGLPALVPIAGSQVLDAPTWQAQPFQALVRLKKDELDLVSCDTACRTVLVGGPGLRNYVPISHSNVILADQRSWDPDALTVAQLGWDIFQAGRAVSAAELRPNYVRASAAEELKVASGLRRP